MSDIKIERFNLTVDDDWKIAIQEEGGAKIGDSRQMLRHSDSAESFIPGPPDEEIPPDQGDLTLLCQGNPAAFWKTLHAVAIQRKPPGVIFGRYLFECLLGKANWGAILAAADPIATIELALTWDKSMATLHRLNWELMHDGEHFLVAQPQRRVAITRRISGVPPAPEPAEMHLSLPPKILFVTGVPLHDPEIRPAAEYLSMLSEFQDSDRSVNSYILVDAKLPELIQTLQD